MLCRQSKHVTREGRLSSLKWESSASGAYPCFIANDAQPEGPPG